MYDIQETEKEVLKFWEDKKIFNKLREKNKGKKKWSFIDGPITANNPMGVHHAWGRTYKDIFQRFKSMQGYKLRYQNGFDCQGLWVEREEEKDLGLKNKEDIEKFGVLNFVNSCRKRVEKFSQVQRDQSIRLGYWMDWDNSYYTMSDDNNLHNWHLIKTYHDKKWLYKGKDTVPWCWRCGTASSKHDIATEGYKEVSHTALFMQFPLKDDPNTYFLIFTTTPWTVPANVAIALNADLDYVKVENEGINYWLAESRLSELEGNYKILKKVKGKELKDKEYVMPYASLSVQNKSPHKVVLWDLASGDEGTGIVHIAPGCGAEDFNLGKKENLPAISPLKDDGTYMEGYEEFSGKKYSQVNKEILNDLDQRRFVYKAVPYKHRYPHCWRCGEELVFRLVDEWYISCKKIREKLINENKKVKWYPEYGKIRQEDWFKNMGDWLISRKRYWGLPLPIWECECEHIEVIGGLKELKEKAIDKKKVDSLKEIHRPWIDEIKLKCPKCNGEMIRIKDVGDAWLDAGIVPFSTLDYLNHQEHWKKWFPANLISENMPGQFRGWFNSLFWASVTLTGKSPFKEVFGYESLKDERGDEMHKSKGNAIWFNDAVERAGADPIRLLYSLQDPSQELKFGYTVLKEPTNSINILYNMKNLISKSNKTKLNNIEDLWIMSRLNNLTQYVTDELSNLHPHLAMRAIQNFWLKDFSRGYVQLIRERVASDEKQAIYVLNEIYITLLKLCAPFLPFITEYIWQDLKERKIVKLESVHLSSWPKPNEKIIDRNLEEEFSEILKIIESGLSERDKIKIGLKWPLGKAIVYGKKKISKEGINIIKDQLNVKEVNFVVGEEINIAYDLKMTPELESEGYSRNISRSIQALRKKTGLVKKDKIELIVLSDKNMVKLLKQQEKFIKDRTNSTRISILEKGGEISGFVDEEFEVKNNLFKIYIKKVK